jgi:predicted signal transduction protein with EAL and GGDEF domain
VVKLLNSLEVPYPELPGDVRISASVGVACWPEHAADADGLLNAADNAMYAAKQRSGEHPAIAMAEPLNPPGAAAQATADQSGPDPT